MQLNNPPLIPHILFEQPLLLILALCAASIIIFLVANRRSDRRMAKLALTPLSLAALIFILSITITTDREHLLTGAQNLVNHTAPMSTDALRTLFTKTATLQGPSGETWLNHDQIFSELERIDQRHNIQSHIIRDIQAEIRTVTRGKLKSTRGLTLINLKTALNTPLGKYDVNTLWLITWEKSNNKKWLIASIQWLEMQNIPPDFGAWR